jgi:hypothetical protein
MNADDVQFYIDQLKSNGCYCGAAKQRGRSFCYSCYMALPKDLRGALWKRMLCGYEEAYEEACQWLEENHL